MDANEAINKLKQLRDNKQKDQFDNTSNAFAKSLNTFKNIIIGAMSDLTGLILQNEPKVTVANFPKPKEIQKVEITNFPIHKKGPEVKKVEVTNQPEIVFDTKEIEKRLLDLKLGLEKIPVELKNSSTEALVKSVKLNNTIDEILSAIKNIKLSPEIKVNVPKTEIPAPIVNIPEIKIPAFPKKITADVNFDELLNTLDEILTEIKYNAGKEVRISNPGDFPVSPSIATFKDSKGVVQQGLVDVDKHVQVDVVESALPDGAATSDKQLPNNHDVKVSNTDYATRAKQDTTNTKLDSLLAKIDLLQAELNQKTEPEDTQEVIDIVHEHIHDGNSFTAFEVISLAAGASRTIIINSNDLKLKHSFFNAYGAEELEIVTYEGVTTTSDGTAIPKLNRNRNSLTASLLTIFHSPTGLSTVGATIIRNRRIGTRSLSGEARMDNEFILKENTKYAVVLTNRGNNTYYLNWWYDWYELAL